MRTVVPHEGVDSLTCPSCGADYPRVHGELTEADGGTVAVYSAELHSRAHDRRVLLAIDLSGDESAVIEAWSTRTEIEMCVRDGAQCPYEPDGETVLDRDEIFATPRREEFFEVADHVVTNDGRVREHLLSRTEPN